MPKVARITHRDGSEHGWIFYCPGCCTNHLYITDGTRGWTFNGDPDWPTFNPSLLHHEVEHMVNGKVVKRPRCHVFVVGGKIVYQQDCGHGLAGQVIEVPEWDD